MNAWLRLLRMLFHVPAPRITREQAVEIALAEAVRRDAPALRSSHYTSPRPSAREGLRDWRVWLEPDFRPCRVVVIDNQTGEVKAYVAPSR